MLFNSAVFTLCQYKKEKLYLSYSLIRHSVILEKKQVIFFILNLIISNKVTVKLERLKKTV